MKNILSLLLVSVCFGNYSFAGAPLNTESAPARSSFYYVGEAKIDGADTFVVLEQVLLPKYSTTPADPVVQLTLTEENATQNSISVRLTKNEGSDAERVSFHGQSAVDKLVVSIEQNSTNELTAHLVYKSEAIDFSLSAPRAMQAL